MRQKDNHSSFVPDELLDVASRDRLKLGGFGIECIPSGMHLGKSFDELFLDAPVSAEITGKHRISEMIQQSDRRSDPRQSSLTAPSVSCGHRKTQMDFNDLLRLKPDLGPGYRLRAESLKTDRYADF
ncbi:hypothetical protein SH449x_002149 [Pirellulaceae bacterium SH449]